MKFNEIKEGIIHIVTEGSKCKTINIGDTINIVGQFVRISSTDANNHIWYLKKKIDNDKKLKKALYQIKLEFNEKYYLDKIKEYEDKIRDLKNILKEGSKK